jgi:hypothetical protein
MDGRLECIACLVNCAAERLDRQSRPPLTSHLFDGDAACQHADQLGDPDTCALDREISTTNIWV